MLSAAALEWRTEARLWRSAERVVPTEERVAAKAVRASAVCWACWAGVGAVVGVVFVVVVGGRVREVRVVGDCEECGVGGELEEAVVMVVRVLGEVMGCVCGGGDGIDIVMDVSGECSGSSWEMCERCSCDCVDIQ